MLAQTLNNGLQVHYKFDNNLLDGTVNNYDLEQVTGSVLYSMVEPNDQCISFNGASSVKSIGVYNNTTYTQCAISLWLKATATTNNLQVIYQGAAAGNAVCIEANTGKLLGFFDGYSVGSYLSSFPITDNEWHHVVCQSDGSKTYLYIDGHLDGSIVEPFTVGDGGSNNRIYFGKTDQNAYPFTGSVNDFRIYNRTLTMCEIQELYGHGMLPKARFSFENSLEDVSGNNNDLQLSSGPAVSYNPFSLGTDNAITFNGSNVASSVLAFDNTDYDELSVSVWLKTNNIENDYQVVVQGAYLGFGLFMAPNTGKIVGYMDGSLAGGYMSNAIVADGDWHHIVLKSDGALTSMYIDGVLDGSLSENLVLGDGSGNNKIFLGKTNLSQYPYTGSLNELMIFDRSLEDCEIEYLSNPANTVGISEMQLQPISMNAYPNPNDGNFYIDMGDVYNNLQVSVFDMQGKLIQNQIQKEGQILQVHIEAAPGIYFVRTTSGNKQGFVKIIKQ